MRDDASAEIERILVSYNKRAAQELWKATRADVREWPGYAEKLTNEMMYTRRALAALVAQREGLQEVSTETYETGGTPLLNHIFGQPSAGRMGARDCEEALSAVFGYLTLRKQLVPKPREPLQEWVTAKDMRLTIERLSQGTLRSPVPCIGQPQNYTPQFIRELK